MNKPANPTCAGCRHEEVRGLPLLFFINGRYCAHPLALDCVSGEALIPCPSMRARRAERSDRKEFCGQQGRNWEPKPVRILARDDSNPVPRVMHLLRSPHL